MTEKPTGRASVLVLGGGYGGISAAKALEDVADVTLVDPTEAFVHNVAAWRTLVEPWWIDRIFLPYAHLLANGRFLRDRAVDVDDRRVTLASGEVLEPDYLVLATGVLSVPGQDPRGPTSPPPGPVSARRMTRCLPTAH